MQIKLSFSCYSRPFSLQIFLFARAFAHSKFNINASPTRNSCWKSFDMLLGDEECRWHIALGFGFSFYVIGSFCYFVPFSVARCAISLSYDVVSASAQHAKDSNFSSTFSDVCIVWLIFFFLTFFLFLI